MSLNRTMFPKDAKRLITAMINMQRPIFVHGSPGIGKSDIIRQIGQAEGRDVYDVRLLLMTEVDVRGIPYFNATTGKMEWAPPGVFPLDEGSNAIIFLDEITQASPSVQAAALQLVLDRKIGDYSLPEKVSIVAAGNTAKDKTGAKPLIKALANRFTHINLVHRFDDWADWAVEASVSPEIVGYLSHKKAHLYTFDAGSPENAFATPRTWVFFVDKFLKSVGKPNGIPEDLLADAIAGAVGEGVAMEFMALRKIMAAMPKAEDILSGAVTNLTNKEINIQYSLIYSCFYQLREMWTDSLEGRIKDEEYCAAFGKFLNFCNTCIEPELVVLAIKLVVPNSKNGAPMMPNQKKIPELKEFVQKNAHILEYIQ